MDDKTVWILTGPTATGKTALSLETARRWNCEIVCMDSMQIYRGMDIGTAKPTAEERAAAPHHMLDICEPEESYSVAQWVEDASARIREIQARGRRALIVGGTGFYLRALRRPMAMGVAAGDPAVRGALEREAAEPGGRERLHGRLREVDPVTAGRLHPNDVRRVVRALEVWQLTGKPFSAQPQETGEAPFRTRCAALTMDRERLYRRIDRRVEQMMKQGLPEEVRGLWERGLTAEHQSMKGIGYKELIPWLKGETSLAEATALIQQNSRHYAKRQWTWFRAEPDVRWVDAEAADAQEQIERAWMEECV